MQYLLLLVFRSFMLQVCLTDGGSRQALSVLAHESSEQGIASALVPTFGGTVEANSNAKI